MDKMGLLHKFKENFDLRDLTPMPYNLNFVLNLCAIVSSTSKIDSIYICPETLSELTNGVFSPEEMSVIEAMWEGNITYQQKHHIDPKVAHKVENALCDIPKNLSRYKTLLDTLISNSGDVYKAAALLYRKSINSEETAQ
jgi:hypothetical protein